MNVLYYLGTIIANVGIALLAISLVVIRNRIPNDVKKSDLENLAAIMASLLLIFGVILEIIGLFNIIKIS
jgi:hypothetical protein